MYFALSAAVASAQPAGIIVIDPGHGGFDSGIKTLQAEEKDFTLALSKELKAVLSERGRKVYLTRQTSTYLSFEERALVAERAGAQMFLSIHGSSDTGYAVYISQYPKGELPPKKKYSPQARQKEHIEDSRALALAIAHALNAELGAKAQFRQMPLPLLNLIDAPAVLIEVPVGNSKAIRRTAEALASGILGYE